MQRSGGHRCRNFLLSDTSLKRCCCIFEGSSLQTSCLKQNPFIVFICNEQNYRVKLETLNYSSLLLAACVPWGEYSSTQKQGTLQERQYVTGGGATGPTGLPEGSGCRQPLLRTPVVVVGWDECCGSLRGLLSLAIQSASPCGSRYHYYLSNC